MPPVPRDGTWTAGAHRLAILFESDLSGILPPPCQPLRNIDPRGEVDLVGPLAFEGGMREHFVVLAHVHATSLRAVARVSNELRYSHWWRSDRYLASMRESE